MVNTLRYGSTSRVSVIDRLRPFKRTSNGEVEGRPEAPDQAPRSHNLFRARGVDIQAVHGPLQGLLGGSFTDVDNGSHRTQFGVDRCLLGVLLVTY
jgi:hypothetical protein